ncbi:hypothetical protein B005_4525 [Nocardiopsis alba ATCC BAA-2165]|uniref:Uncharacterized protein n=1 Tax=Nocardiopsis alba (strain ATCC BAA-2165 / BE74) TaxID=1205910 RepID=J7L0M6_NOCAA|nr:hypothetical protein B005_4525 [Nocardiopsis alba ATCC BAA-2165]
MTARARRAESSAIRSTNPSGPSTVKSRPVRASTIAIHSWESTRAV